MIHSPNRDAKNGSIGDNIAIPAPTKKIAPMEILSLVKRSDLFCTVRTLPLSKLPFSSSNLTVTVASPVSSGSKL